MIKLLKSYPNNTEINKTEGNKIHPIPSEEEILREREAYETYLLDQLDMEILAARYPDDADVLEAMFQMILDVVCSNRSKIRIAGDDKPAPVVKSQFLKLNSSHMEYVLDCMKQNSTKVRNMKQYLLAALYNAPFTMNVVTDPKGSIVCECGNAMLRYHYRIKIFNTINFRKSMHYNPFAYIHSEKDILKLVTTLITNTKGDGKSGDEFWEKSEKLLYSALIGYIHYEAPEEEQNFATLLEMINAMEVREGDEEFKNAVDLMFEELSKQNPDHFAVRQYAKYKLAAGKTAKSILVSCGARLAPFDIKELRELTAYDELELDTLGDQKTALFLIMSDTDDTFNFLISMIYSQLFNLLCEKADDVYGGRLPVHVRCLIDEAANIGQIPHLEKLMATIRSREISAALVLQAKSQLKAIYKDNADTIIGNCDSQVFLGGSEQSTLKDLNTILGKETIDLYNTGESRGSQESHSTNYQKMGKELMSVDELSVMDGGKCIVQLRGVRPFLSEKYDLTAHPNYSLTADYDKKYYFDIEKFLNRKLTLKGEEQYEVIEIKQ